MNLTTKQIKRFWDQVVKNENDSWQWTGTKTPQGYGWSRAGHRQHFAHRIAWELHRGPIPEGLCVLHKDESLGRTEVNPVNLFLGTRADNAADMAKKGRGRRVLTNEQVSSIRVQYATGLVTQRYLARVFGVSQATISDIINHKHYIFVV